MKSLSTQNNWTAVNIQMCFLTKDDLTAHINRVVGVALVITLRFVKVCFETWFWIIFLLPSLWFTLTIENPERGGAWMEVGRTCSNHQSSD